MFRIQHVNFEKIFNVYDLDTLDTNEWENASRLKESGWESRYQYESEIIRGIIAERNIKSVLEVGSGPGILSQKIQKDIALEYHLIDKPFAKKYFDEHNFRGKFFVKDVSMELNTTGLLPSYDMIICNDVLEHLLSPTSIIRTFHGLMTPTSTVFISVPNWRMAHQFIYRGLFDYDNFLYFLYIHKLEVVEVYPSPLQTPPYPKLSSESCMPDELTTSWNWYFVAQQKKS